MAKELAQDSLQSNPFMMLMNPEVVLAAVERSERLSRLNRHLCRPLDKPIIAPTGGNPETAAPNFDDDGDDGFELNESTST